MTRKASSLPWRNSPTSCSSDRRRSQGEVADPRPRLAGTLRADASTKLLANHNWTRERKLRQFSLAVTGSPEIRHHVLDLGVVLEGVHREVLAVAGLLVAAVRHLADERDVVVDPHAAEAQPVGDAQRAADVTGPHRGGQAVWRAVGPGDGLVLVAELLDGDDRAEDLALDHVVVLPEVGHHRRLEVEAG